MKQADNAVEAAKRVAGHTGGYGDTLIVAWAYLAEHPGDDETPVDVAWLDRCDGIFSSDEDEGVLYVDKSEWINIWVCNQKVDLLIDGRTLMESPTRGDVRRLARALKIDLKEGKS